MEINTKVAGISNYEVPDLLPGTVLKLVPEPTNVYDPTAVMIQTSNSVKLGYVRREKDLAMRVFKAISEGKNVSCKVLQSTGGTQGKTKGLNIQIVIL